MKIEKYQILFAFLLVVSWVSSLQAYEIQIEKGPAIDAGPNTFFAKNAPKESETLISWLGGTEELEKILIGTPFANSGQVEFTKEYVRNRFEKSICVNSEMDKWHYAPFTMGTIYFKNGNKINFEMYLSGILISKNLFALN
ncbi:MAG: hypothetical protein V2J25_04300 [Desulfatiglans sp.]|nr:hypothetical protein [Desulfatiglans sp.]